MPVVQMTDVYRSLVANLRDKLGGTITEANADAIAHAAAQVYRREVEPRLWEEKTAHQLLDSFGVPRSGAFVPYSLSDRLLLLHRSEAEDPYRGQAHELLDELAVPRRDETGREHSLPARLTLLLGSLDGIPGAPASGGNPGPDGARDAAEDSGEASARERGGEDGPAGMDGDGDGQDAGDEGGADGPDGPDGEVAGPELVSALEAIQRAVKPDGDGESSGPPAPPPPPPPATAPPAPDLIGLGGLLGSIQEELVEVRQAVESLRQEVRDAVALFQTGGLAAGGPEIVVRRDLPQIPATEEAAPDAAPPGAEASPPEPGPDAVLPAAGSPDGEGDGEGSPDGEGSGDGSPDGEGDGAGKADAGKVAGKADVAVGTTVPPEEAGPDGAPEVPAAAAAGPHDPTRVLPAVSEAPPDGPAPLDKVADVEPAVPRRRSRRFVVLVLLVVVIAVLLAAGVTAAVVLGWDQLQSRFIDTIAVPPWGGRAPW